MMKGLFKGLVILSLFVSLGFIQNLYGQCTTTTVNIDLSGAQAAGCCNVCGSDYRCYTTGAATGCTFGSSLSSTFADPVPGGNIVVSAQVNYYYNCGSSISWSDFLNGTNVGPVNFTAPDCSCGSCYFTSSTASIFNCGIPGYVYGGNNTISTSFLSGSGSVCIDRIEVVLCYRSSIPNAGTASSNTTTVCSGQGVNLTLAGYQTGASIQWQSGPTSGGPWTSIGGATSAAYATGGLASNICYRAQVTCGGVNYSNVVCITVNPPPTVNVGTVSTCAGTPTVLTSTVSPGGGSYNWTPGGYTTPNITVTPASTQVYNLTYTSISGCTASATGTVFVNTAPVLSVNNPSICTGQSTTLTANGTPAGGSYAWNTGPITSSIVVSPPSSTSYTVSYTSLLGCTSTTVSNVTVNPIPTVAVSNPTICSAGSATITSTVTPAGGTYSWLPMGSTSPSVVVSPTMATTYTLQYTSLSGCSTSTTALVSIAPSPTVSVSNATICAGQTATLNAIANPVGGTYSWTPGGFTTSSITVSPALTQVYNLVYTNGCSASTSATVYVNPTPTITVNNPIVCAGESTTLTANGTPAGGSYVWTPGGAPTSSIIITPPSSTSYTVNYTDLNGCMSSTVSNITVNPIPTVAVNNATICGAGSATLTSTVNPIGGLYSWTPGGYTTPNVVVSPGSTTTYTLSYLSPAGCTNTTTALVTVSSNPTIAVNSATLCSGPGASVVLTATVSPMGGTYTWTPIGGGGPIVVVSPTSSIGYTVTYTEPSGCSNSAVAFVTVLPGLSFADFTYPSHPCFDSQPFTYSATVSGSGPYTYQWYFGNGSSPSTATTLSASVNYSFSGIKDVSLVVYNTSSGCKDSISHLVTIEDLPFVNFSATNPNCVSDTVHFSNYSWIGGSATIASWYWNFGDGNSSTAYLPNHLYATGGTYTVYLVATSDFGCDDTLFKTITVSPLTVPGSIASSNTVCAISNMGTVSISGNNGNITSWMFSTDGGTTWLPIANTNTVFTYNNLQTTTQYAALVQSGACPSASTSPNATITVDAASKAGFIRRDTVVCFGINHGTLTLTNYTGSIVNWYSSNNGTIWTSLTNTTNIYNFNNLIDTTYYHAIVQNGICPPDTTPNTTVWIKYFNGAQIHPHPDTSISMGYSVQIVASGGVQYAWTPHYNISDTTINNPFVWPIKDTSYIVYVKDSYGCIDTAQVTIIVLKDFNVIVANTMTPNGDNYNDYFWIGNIEYYPNNEVTVFNRYGQVLFQTTGYNNTSNHWDGTYQGQKVPDGAYYYVLKFTDNNTVYKGSINIISSK